MVDAGVASNTRQRLCSIANGLRPSHVASLHRTRQNIRGVLLHSLTGRWGQCQTGSELTVAGDSNPPPMCCARGGGFYFDGHGRCWFGLDRDEFTVRWGGRCHATVAA